MWMKWNYGRLCKPRDIVDCYKLGGDPYTLVSWGCVERDGSVLVVERNDPGDPLRSGQLVLPGGRIKRNETALQAARREVHEETCVVTASGKRDRFINLHEYAIVKPRENAVGIYEPEDGSFWIAYGDSGKRYIGWMFDLVPQTDPGRPEEDESSNPRYAPLADVWGSLQDQLTPATQILMEIAGHHHGREIVCDGDLLMLPCDMTNFLRTVISD